MNKLSIVYSPLSKAATFVLNGIDIESVNLIPLEIRKNKFSKLLFYLFMRIGLYKLAGLVRYNRQTLVDIAKTTEKILFYDCCKPKEYLALNAIIKCDNKTIFFWNPLSMWSTDQIYLKAILEKLRNIGFTLCSFDFYDSKKYNLQLLKNINRRYVLNEDVPIDNDFYFVGLPKGREKILQKIENILKEKGFKTNFIIIKDSSSYISQYDNIKHSSGARCIVDIVSENQTGLTLRPFDALFLKKKIITNSKIIKDADFYHPDNIYVIEDFQLIGIEDFMTKPYHDIPEDIINQYEVNHWIINYFIK